jgi:glutamate--cysteine ligase
MTLLDKELETVGGIPQIQQAVESIEREGFDAVIYNGKTAAEWSDHLIGIASGNLSYAEKEYLEHVRAFRSNSKAKDSSQRSA